MGRFLSTVFVLLLCAGAGCYWFLYSGSYNVAATSGHTAVVRWTMDTTMTESVKHHAANIHPPTGINLRDPSTIERAAIPYNTVCKTCHGAPGVKRAEWVVMTPEPPDLQRTADSWSDGELYWIIKNGIKMTGMPAFGPSRSESDLWAMVAFVRNLPRMSAPQYSRLIQAASAEPPEAGDGHSR